MEDGDPGLEVEKDFSLLGDRGYHWKDMVGDNINDKGGGGFVH